MAGKLFWILGAARSGCAAGALLRRHGAVAVGIDDMSEADLCRRWEREGLTSMAPGAFAEIHTGGTRPSAAQAPHAVIVSPGVRPGHDLLASLPAGVEVMGELELAGRFCPADLVVVTGTNGKSTVTAWCAHVLGQGGRRAEAVGNLGRPLAVVADDLGPEDVAVVEVSSFQLETMHTFAPRAAAVLNLAPDHLDRYPSLAAYYAAKERLAALMPAGSSLAVWTGCPEAGQWDTAADRVLFGDLAAGAQVGYEDGTLVRMKAGRRHPILSAGELSLQSPPNLLNALAVTALAGVLGVDDASLAEGLRNYGGLPHRHQRVGRLGPVDFIDDSKATNVHAVCSGLRGYPRKVVLIVGGSGKGEDYSPLVEAMAAVTAVVTIGREGPAIARALAGVVPLHAASTMAEAVATGYDLARNNGAAVLLSPACASFDMFANYRERGRAFAAAAADLGAARD